MYPFFKEISLSLSHFLARWAFMKHQIGAVVTPLGLRFESTTRWLS